MKGIRPSDYVLTGILVVIAVLIGIENVTAGADAEVAHPLTTQTPLMIPVFIAATLPILWRRAAVLPALGASLAILALSLPAFGWVTRCGFGLPLMLAFAYAVARFGGSWARQAVGLLGITAAQVVLLIWDSSTGGLEPLPYAVALTAAGYAAGKIVNAVAHRSTVIEPKLEHAH